MRKKRISGITLGILLSSLLTVSIHAADYSFSGLDNTDYYVPSSYETVYGSRFNYGGHNLADYQIPALEYGTFSTTQTGVMEKTLLPGLQQYVGATDVSFGAIASPLSPASALPAATISDTAKQNANITIVSAKAAFTKLTERFKLSNGAVGKISIPAIGVKDFYLWEGETSNSMSKGLGHFESSSVWDGNVCICGHNRGSKYSIGAIKDLKIGDTITYMTTAGTRSYSVTTVAKINNNDWSYLRETADNRITLITCVAGDSSHRWAVQAVQAR